VLLTFDLGEWILRKTLPSEHLEGRYQQPKVFWTEPVVFVASRMIEFGIHSTIYGVDVLDMVLKSPCAARGPVSKWMFVSVS
jgi:hypothetical protein